MTIANTTFEDINIELGYAANTPISFNDAEVCALVGKSVGDPISLADFLGVSAFTPYPNTLSHYESIAYRPDVAIGNQVSFSPNGLYLAIAVAYDANVLIFHKSGGEWSLQQMVSRNDYNTWYPSNGEDTWGCSVAFADDSTLIVGDYEGDYYAPNDAYRGSVCVLVRSGASWSGVGQYIPSPYTDKATSFGSRVAYADGHLFIRSTYGSSDTQAAVHVYTGSSASWVHRTTIVLSGESANNTYGMLKAVGNTLFIGMPRNNSAQGQVLIYTGSNASWSLQDTLSPVGANGDYFGNIGDCSEDAFLSAQDEDRVLYYTRSGSTWTLSDNLLLAYNMDIPSTDPFTPNPIALHGKLLTVGFSEIASVGRVHSYVLNSSGAFELKSTIVHPQPANVEEPSGFGWTTATNGVDTVVISTDKEDGSGESDYAGGLYVYNYEE